MFQLLIKTLFFSKELDVVDINLNVKHLASVLRSTMPVMEYLNVVMAVMKLLNWLVQQQLVRYKTLSEMTIQM